jgi:hypothetical protein
MLLILVQQLLLFLLPALTMLLYCTVAADDFFAVDVADDAGGVTAVVCWLFGPLLKKGHALPRVPFSPSLFLLHS